jgi:cellulose synthase/poly-beta-1,6-N-acetylglucosamine synthase-like glycosyltransferase
MVQLFYSGMTNFLSNVFILIQSTVFVIRSYSGLFPVFYGKQAKGVSHFSNLPVLILLTPPRIEWKYKTVTILFALLMMYLIAAAVVCAIQAAKDGGNTYRVMLFSLIITYGGKSVILFDEDTVKVGDFAAWAASSLLAFDPWHMITSCIPYLLLSPSYFNVLNMCVPRRSSRSSITDPTLSYAYSNLDDVSDL